MKFSHTKLGEGGTWPRIRILDITLGDVSVSFLLLYEATAFPSNQPFRNSAYSHTLSSWVFLIKKTLRLLLVWTCFLFEYTFYLSCEFANKVLLHSCMGDLWHLVCWNWCSENLMITERFRMLRIEAKDLNFAESFGPMSFRTQIKFNTTNPCSIVSVGQPAQR